MGLATPPLPPNLRVGRPGREHAARFPHTPAPPLENALPVPPAKRTSCAVFKASLAGASLLMSHFPAAVLKPFPTSTGGEMAALHPKCPTAPPQGVTKPPGRGGGTWVCSFPERLTSWSQGGAVPLGSHLALWGLPSPGPGGTPQNGVQAAWAPCLGLCSSSLPASSRSPRERRGRGWGDEKQG